MRTRLKNWPIKRMLVCGIPFILMACSSSIVDYTNHIATNNLTNQCFELTNDSFVYQARCVALDTVGRDICMGLQSFQVDEHPEKVPLSYFKYMQHTKYWNKKMFTKGKFVGQRSILYGVEKGTKIVISKIVRYPWDDKSLKWVVRGTLDNKDTGGVEVELPTISALAHGPIWIENEKSESPVFDSNFLKKCGS